MSVQHRRTTSAVALDELKRRRDLESLRKFLISEQCFPATKDPMTAVITMEELKKLARIWKLNERRNFWKTHSERNEMVVALLEHSEQNKDFIPAAVTPKKLTKIPSLENVPMPPIELKPSVQSHNNIRKLKNYCGKKYFNRDGGDDQIMASSRFFEFPDPTTHVDRIVDVWRSEDFNMKDENAVTNGINRSQSLTAPTPGRYTISQGAAKNKIKMLKHRNLSAHLMNYSANADFVKSPLTLKAVQTFINVAETDDIRTVTNCMIAISNISSCEAVRLLLFEINAMHKFTNFLQHTRGATGLWAAALLFYYFSCDKEGEDRVYNSCSAFAQTNGSSADPDMRLVALYTMNNLMPCIDRQRVVEIAMRIINGMIDTSSVVRADNCFDKGLAGTCLLVLQNMSCFSNAHTTLLALGISDLLSHFAKLAVCHKSSDMALGVAKILNSFLFLPEQAANLVTVEYVNVLVVLVQGGELELLLAQCMKAAVILSSIPSLKSVIRQTALVASVAEMVLRKQSLSGGLARDVCRFFSNITLPSQSTASPQHQTSPEVDMQQMERLADEKVPEAIFSVLKSGTVSAPLKSVAMQALQNILSVRENSIRLAAVCFDPLVKMLRETQDLSAANALYNISCVPECRSSLVEHRIHLTMLDLLGAVRELDVKSAYLQILVQMSSSNVCVLDMLGAGLIAKLEAQLRQGTSQEIWKDISTMLLAVVAFAASSLSAEDHVSIVRILEVVCVKGTSEEIVENSSSVLKYVSVRYSVFEDLNPVVRAILALSDSEVVVESLSTVLYNMTCTARNVALMLTDEQYVNIMIRIMRGGKVEVQENIAQAMRTLCSVDRGTQILLKNDILSDLIVIALLRTSSEEIKVVCSEAFYNMLCHEPTRLRLLKGDLWWAVMRLCRTDSHLVRKICARALFDLSCDASNVAPLPLREHHVLSFVKDISTSGSDEFLSRCLQSVHNLIRQFATEGPTAIATHEIIACVRIGADALHRCKNLDALREALILLLRCAQSDLSSGTDTEFINLDVVDTLDVTRELWGGDADCRLLVSRLLWELSRSGFFTKSVSLADLDPIFVTIYSSDHVVGEITDNIAAVFMQFVLRERVPPSQFIALPIWGRLLNDTLGAVHITSSALPTVSEDTADAGGAASTSPTKSRAWKARETLYRGDTLSNSESRELLRQATSSNSRVSFATRGIVLSVLAYASKEHIADSGAKTRVNKALIAGILTNDLLDNPLTRPNLLHVIQAASEVGVLCMYLVEAGVFRLLSRYLNNSIGTNKQDRAQEYCATFLHNLSLHASILSRVIATSDGTVDQLVRDILEVPNPSVLLDLAVFFYNISTCLVDNDASLNPRFVLDMIKRMTQIDPETVASTTDGVAGKEPHSNQGSSVTAGSMVASINKYTISTVLNTYSFEAGVDPAFVQSMFIYMQRNPTSLVPDYMEASVRYKPCESDMQAVLLPDFTRGRPSISVPLMSFEPDATKWQPTVLTDPKCNQNIILKFTQAQPQVHDKLEASDSHAPPVFSKIIKQFDRVREAMVGGGTDNVALLEGDEDDDVEEEGENEDEFDDVGRRDSDVEGEGEEKGDTAAVAAAADDGEHAAALQHSGSDAVTGSNQENSDDMRYEASDSDSLCKAHSPKRFQAQPPSGAPSPSGSTKGRNQFSRHNSNNSTTAAVSNV